MNNAINLYKVIIKTCDYQECLSDIQHIRTVVFIEEQSVPAALEWDKYDTECIHVLAYYDNKPIATARLLKDGHIGRMAVLAEFRQQHIGQKLLQYMINLAQEKALKIQLSSQQHAVDFYAKQGFYITSDIYMDAGIPHYDMEYKQTEEV